MSVYLLHFSTPFKHARHYLGYTEDVPARLRLHRSGQAARLTAVAGEAGITFVVARVWWHGDRALERRLKRQKQGPRLCPICRAEPKGCR